LALAPGTRLSVYEVTAPLGEGGMGQVYRATDTALGRQVAIKILPDVFAVDPDRMARFEREARTLASLNHPHIAAIYGVEKSAGTHALVMELVEGDDLSQRIARAAIPLDEALPIAKQIAEALEAAHEQGIIHRDLKPANIKVRTDGMVKVLDFGLAKAIDPAGALSASASMSPAVTAPAMTHVGMILGTAAYMAPEQARGREVDRRADIWSFGVVLYEMLSGRRAFAGDDNTDTIAAVVSKEPDWAALPADIPAPIRKLLRRCLEKDRQRRLTDAGAARLEIEEALAPTRSRESDVAPPAAASARRGRLAWIVAAAALAAAVALAFPAVRYLRLPPPPETRVDIATPSTVQPTSFALSPDGRQIVFVASADGASRLWLRSLATTTAQPLPGTEGASYPFWMHDSRSIGFFAGGASGGALKRIDLDGGTPKTLASAPGGCGGTATTDGVVLFAPSSLGPLMRVSAAGGTPVESTTLGPQQSAHRWPYMLPGSHRFLFYVFGAPEVAGIYLGALDGSASARLTPADSAGVYLPSGWLLWARAGALVAQRLDLAQAALTGEPVTLADGVAVDANSLSAVSVSATGLVAYRTSGASRRQLMWVDRSGSPLGTVGAPDINDLAHPRLSPDGRRVVVHRTVQGNSDIWLLDGARTSRLTFDAAVDERPIWSHDGTRLVFRSNRAGRWDLYEKQTSGAGAEERIVSSEGSKAAYSWSADGRFLLYVIVDPQQNADLWVVSMVGDRTTSAFLKTRYREAYGAFSPDGRWVAYQSNESGRPEIYVRPFVPPGAADKVTAALGGQWQVSTDGGVFPAWRSDGQELYYLDPSGVMMAASITATETTLEPGAPVALFRAAIFGGGVDAQQGRQYDVARDGRFLINRELDSAAAPITLLQNWNPGAKK
jgi:Tol biopolymer transport system component